MKRLIYGFCLTYLLFIPELKAQNYFMVIDDVLPLGPGNISFSVYVSAHENNFQLNAYQVSVSLNPLNYTDSLVFSYVPGSSELNNFPAYGIGVHYTDSVPEAAFASGAGIFDTITVNRKKVGTFTLSCPKEFNFSGNNVQWNFTGSVSTILVSEGGKVITKPENHKIILNHSPFFNSSLKTANTSAGDTVKFQYTAADPDNDKIIFSIASVMPETRGVLTIDSDSGMLTFIPGNDDAGKNIQVVVKVSDGKTFIFSDEGFINVRKNNTQPVVTAADSFYTALPGDTLKLKITAADPDGDTLKYSVASFQPEPSGNFGIDSISGVFFFNPSKADEDSLFDLVIKISDGKAITFTGSIKVCVQKINSVPQLVTVLPDTTVFVQDSLNFKFQAFDIDNDTLKYSVRNTGDEITGCYVVDSLSGFFTYCPAIEDTGKVPGFVLSVYDGKDTTSSDVIKIVVKNNLLSSVHTSIPAEFKLYQNYPNPFNPATKIRYVLPSGAKTSLKLYDMLGNLVTSLVDEEQGAGEYEINLEAGGLASGVYLYILTSGPHKQTKKLMLLK